jgi:hypothetical protein
VVERLFPTTLPYVLDSAASFGFAGFNGRAMTDNVENVMLSLQANTPIDQGAAVDRTNIPSEFPYFGAPVRRSRRAKRLDAIRAAVEAVGAPAQATAEATAMVLRLSGADASWPLHDSYGLPLERIPDVIAHTVEHIIRDLRTHVTDETPT